MDTHVCKQCGSRFVYCRACVFRPIKYKDLGYCTKECYEASKVKVEPVVEETTSAEDIAPIEEIFMEVETEENSSTEIEEAILVEAPTETTIKKETNTYKKKKNKYKYTSSY